ncbi:MAG: UbiA family prenyltransferase [Candidatus Poribacteria bacterium]
MNLFAYIRLIRPLNGLIAFISVILGALLSSGGINPIARVLVASFVSALLLSAGNAFNDYCDVESDRVNKPSRPIPSGQIKRQSALKFSVLLFIIGVVLAIFVNWIGFLIALIVSLLLVLYATKLRTIPLLANSTVGFLTGLTFIYGGLAVESAKGAVIPGIFAFLFTVAREVVKDIQDVKGDQSAGMSSLAIDWGTKKAVYISLIFFALLIIVSPIPYIIGYYSLYYLICAVLGVDAVLVYCVVSLLRNPSEANSARIASIMKFDIFVGLVAIYLGSFG